MSASRSRSRSSEDGVPVAKRSIGVEDWWQIRRITDLQTSRLARTALVVQSVSQQRNERHSHIWLVSQDGRERQRLSDETAFDDGPRWSPDARKLAISSAASADAVRYLEIVDAGTGERRRLAGSEGARCAAWSPAGDALCFVAGVPLDDLSVAAEDAWYGAHPDARPAPRLQRATSLRARSDGTGYRTHSAQLFTLALGGSDAPVRLTSGDGDDGDPAWSPDGRSVAFVSSRSDDRRVFRERNIWLADVASGTARQLTFGHWLWGPLAWSPDGRYIACFGMARLAVPLSIRAWIVGIDGDAPEAATEGLGAHIWPHGAPLWIGGGERLIAAGGIGNTGALVAYDRESRTRSVLLTADAVFGLLGLLPDGTTILAAATTSQSPSMLVSASVSDAELRPLFDVNTWLDDVTLAPTRRVSFTTADGWEIGGWLVTPAPSALPPPCVIDVHYGPNAAWGPAFAAQAQALAGGGIATLFLNPRGSTGYGDDFAAAADFGERDYADLMTGIDALIAQGCIDGERLGITGLSYGGFMASWAIAQTSRFRAAVSINGITNQLSWYLLSDTGLFFYADRFGDPFEDPQRMDAYWRHSPLAYSARISTPLLLLHGEEDYRCPIDQSEQLFGALVARGKTVELVRFPRASHDLLGTATPVHAYLAQKLSLEWFARYLRA